MKKKTGLLHIKEFSSYAAAPPDHQYVFLFELIRCSYFAGVSTVFSDVVVTPSLVSVVEVYVFVPLSVDVDISKLVEDVVWDWHPARANAATKAPVIATILSDFIFTLLISFYLFVLIICLCFCFTTICTLTIERGLKLFYFLVTNLFALTFQSKFQPFWNLVRKTLSKRPAGI